MLVLKGVKAVTTKSNIKMGPVATAIDVAAVMRGPVVCCSTGDRFQVARKDEMRWQSKKLCRFAHTNETRPQHNESRLHATQCCPDLDIEVQRGRCARRHQP